MSKTAEQKIKEKIKEDINYLLLYIDTEYLSVVKTRLESALNLIPSEIKSFSSPYSNRTFEAVPVETRPEESAEYCIIDKNGNMWMSFYNDLEDEWEMSNVVSWLRELPSPVSSSDIEKGVSDEAKWTDKEMKSLIDWMWRCNYRPLKNAKNISWPCFTRGSGSSSISQPIDKVFRDFVKQLHEQ